MSSFAADPPWSRREVLRGAGIGMALLTGAVACSNGNRRGHPPAGNAGLGDVTAFGAVGDGHTDDTAALQRALAALRPGQPLLFPAGRKFCHSQTLTVTAAGAQLIGPGELCATDEQRSALKIEANDVSIDGLRLSMRSTTRRWDSPDQHKLFVGRRRGLRVRNLSIAGSAAAGVFCQGTSAFALDGLHVSDTRADGVHVTGGAHDGLVANALVERTGDDGIAVVSYLADNSPCQRIVMRAPQVRTTTGGRGLSVVGGQDISYTDLIVDASSAAAVYVACEGDPYNTFPSRQVRMLGGMITNANTDTRIDHGAVLVYSGRDRGLVQDVQVAGLSIRGTRPSASRQLGVVADGPRDAVTGVVFHDVQLASTPQPYQGNAPRSAFGLVNVTVDGKALQPSQVKLS